MSPNLSDQTKFRLKKINGIKDSFITKICKRELMSKRLSKYIAAFDYFDKVLIVLSGTSGLISTASFATIIGATVGTTSASFRFEFSITTGTIKNF